MTDNSRDEVGDSSEPADGEIPDDELEVAFEAMVPFEPYTDEQFAADLEIQKRKAREYLRRLETREEVHRKDIKGSPPIWIREPKPQTCPSCDRAFEVKYLHAIFSSSRFCPRCGTKLPAR
ncbi:hypothetical protein JCM17823_24640 [Halorubrum gandharaense]